MLAKLYQIINNSFFKVLTYSLLLMFLCTSSAFLFINLGYPWVSVFSFSSTLVLGMNFIDALSLKDAQKHINEQDAIIREQNTLIKRFLNLSKIMANRPGGIDSREIMNDKTIH